MDVSRGRQIGLVTRRPTITSGGSLPQEQTKSNRRITTIRIILLEAMKAELCSQTVYHVTAGHDDRPTLARLHTSLSITLNDEQPEFSALASIPGPDIPGYQVTRTLPRVMAPHRFLILPRWTSEPGQLCGGGQQAEKALCRGGGGQQAEKALCRGGGGQQAEKALCRGG
ncbi:hypothetical protein RRG08_023312 [Elysia crispata]|uniref:Uncharacterized protein n=1 Tax=Elysia crispata TaxID=231223 RepID=A0AAE1EDH0_9GAST|nr:hypothetical protein RRG08_023312 [Elysia crispata]